MNHEHHFTLQMDDEVQSDMNAIFPGGSVIASVGEILQTEFDRFARNLNEIYIRRGETAISGAMRWPWSQEYAMRHPKLKELR